MLLAHKIELRPTAAQIEYLNKACGARRHCYNQLLAHFSKPENKWSKKSAVEYYMTVIRKEFPWYDEVSQRVTRNAIDDLDTAYSNFFRKTKRSGYPKFKKRDVNDGFALRETEKFSVEGRSLRIEKLKTWIDMRECLRFSGKTKQVTITKKAGKFYASILVETEDYNPKDVDRQPSVGVDFGVKDLAILSTGFIFKALNALKKNLKKLKKLQRSLSKKQKGSKNRAKAKLKIQKLHARITRQRHALLHEISDYLTANFDVITIEDLNVSGMMKNHKLARAIGDCGFGYLRQYIEYKAALRNCTVVVADRFFASSKTCSGCGNKKKYLPLSERTYKCDCCGLVMDRDLNAAINLDKYGRDTLKPDLKRIQELSETCSLSIGVDGMNNVSNINFC